MVFCKAGRYQQLFLVDENGEIATRDIPYILNLIKCEPHAVAAALPEGYNELVMKTKEQFDKEVQARRAEQEHTKHLTKSQRYIRKELNVLFRETEDEDKRKQLNVLMKAFTQYIPIPAIRAAIDRIRRDKLTGERFLEVLSQIYHLHRMKDYLSNDRDLDKATGNDALPRVICSEWLGD
jgi:hypothetical protein